MVDISAGTRDDLSLPPSSWSDTTSLSLDMALNNGFTDDESFDLVDHTVSYGVVTLNKNNSFVLISNNSKIDY